MKKSSWPLASTFFLCLFLARSSQATGGGVGNDNPAGVTGEYNGSITTAGSYDPYTGNAKRVVDDLTVTGAVGAYPLKWSRILNTRNPGGWSMPYQWRLQLRPPDPYPPPTPPPGPPPIYEGPDGMVSYPDGRETQVYWDGSAYQMQTGAEPGDRLIPMTNDNYDLIMQDGGRVRFQHPNPQTPNWWDYVVTAIFDPYGQPTTLTYDSFGRLWKVTEPGGRYLQVNYPTSSSAYNGVQAFDGRGNLIETVTYIWQPLTFVGHTYTYLTQVQYDDNTAAAYTYQSNNRADTWSGLIETCYDPRYAGAMKKIKYRFKTRDSNHLFPASGQIEEEQNATTGVTVSKITYPPDYPPITVPPPERLQRTETRGGGSDIGRVFQYNLFAELVGHADFEGHPSSITYERPGYGSSYYFKILTDARMNETRIEKSVIAAAVLSVTRGTVSPATVRYTYSDPNNPYYVASKTDERLKSTYYTRYPADHPHYPNAIQRIDYPDGGFETFVYNNFGQVLDHQMTSGGTEHFLYDTRGLKTFYWPPATQSDGAPQSHPTGVTPKSRT